MSLTWDLLLDPGDPTATSGPLPCLVLVVPKDEEVPLRVAARGQEGVDVGCEARPADLFQGGSYWVAVKERDLDYRVMDI